MTADYLTLNGRRHPYPGPELMTLLQELDIPPDARGVAVARNGEVVPRAQWATTALQPGDEIDVVGAVQGG